MVFQRSNVLPLPGRDGIEILYLDAYKRVFHLVGLSPAQPPQLGLLPLMAAADRTAVSPSFYMSRMRHGWRWEGFELCIESCC